MKIGLVSERCCIRILKFCIALRDAGHSVHAISQVVPVGRNYYSSVSLFTDDNSLRNIVSSLNMDLYQVNNEPDTLVKPTKESAGTRPVLFDIHDLMCLRDSNMVVQPEEEEAFNYADAFIHVSEPILKIAQEKHGSSKPSIVIYSSMNKIFLARDEDIIPDPSYKSLVYEGGLNSTLKPELVNDGKEILTSVRYNVSTFEAFRKQGYAVNLFSAVPLQNALYESIGCMVAKPMMYPSMLYGLRPHGIGFVGSTFSIPLMEMAMPNKLFEYMSQGVVPVCYNAGESAKFCAKYDCGIELKGLDNLDKQLRDAKYKRLNVLKVRKNFTMESQIPKLLELYETLIPMMVSVKV